MDVFVIHSPENDEETPPFHLMVHLPIRFTPQAVPLLLLSVIDLQLVKLLVEQGKRKDEQLQLDCKHINDQNCTFYRTDANSTETIRLLCNCVFS